MQQNGFIQFSITARYAMRPFIKILWPRCCCCCHLLVCCQKRKNCSYFCVHCLCIVGWSSWASSARLFCHHLGRPPHRSEQWCLRSAWEEVIDSGCWHQLLCLAGSSWILWASFLYFLFLSFFLREDVAICAEASDWPCAQPHVP